MRVVLDANVFVSAAIRTGPSHRIVQAWLESEAFEVVLCPALLDEVRQVLTERPRLRRWIDPDTARGYLTTLEVLATVQPDPDPIERTTRDPDDDYLVALARSHRADYIVTGDKDLLDWTDQDPPVVSPATFETVVATQPPVAG